MIQSGRHAGLRLEGQSIEASGIPGSEAHRRPSVGAFAGCRLAGESANRHWRHGRVERRLDSRQRRWRASFQVDGNRCELFRAGSRPARPLIRRRSHLRLRPDGGGTSRQSSGTTSGRDWTGAVLKRTHTTSSLLTSSGHRMCSHDFREPVTGRTQGRHLGTGLKGACEVEGCGSVRNPLLAAFGGPAWVRSSTAWSRSSATTWTVVWWRARLMAT